MLASSCVDLLLCMLEIGSQQFRRGQNFSPVWRHIVPSLPPTQYNIPSMAATPQLDRREVMEGTASHLPTRPSSLSTEDW